RRAVRGTGGGRGRPPVLRRIVPHHLSGPVQLPSHPRSTRRRDHRLHQRPRNALAGERGRGAQRRSALLRQRARPHLPRDAAGSLRRGGGRRHERRTHPRRVRRRRHQRPAHPRRAAEDLRQADSGRQRRGAGHLRDGVHRRDRVCARGEALLLLAGRRPDPARRAPRRSGGLMGEKIPPVKGTRDVLPTDTYLKKDDPWVRTGHLQLIEQAARDIFPLYGYREARTPILERTALFARGIGDATDIDSKEMYTFEDRDGTQVTMRPEGTASLVRAYVEHAVQQQGGETKWWYAGPMFRHERQQRGRYRQFTQIGVEALGSTGPRIDAEQIEMLDRWLRFLAVPFEMHVNTLGDARCRPAYRTALQEYLRANADRLCEDCKKRTETNPIRVLDCKNPRCQEVAAGAPRIRRRSRAARAARRAGGSREGGAAGRLPRAARSRRGSPRGRARETSPGSGYRRGGLLPRVQRRQPAQARQRPRRAFRARRRRAGAVERPHQAQGATHRRAARGRSRPPAGRSETARSEHAAERRIAVEDRVGAPLEAMGAAEAHVGRQDVAEDDFRPQLRAGTCMQGEGMVARQEGAVLERHPGVADVGKDGPVQPAEIEGERPHSSLDVEERQAVLEGAERVRFAEEGAGAVAAKDAHRRVHGVEDGAHRVAGVEAPEREEMPLILVAACDPAREPRGEHVMKRRCRPRPREREVARVGGGQLTEVEIGSQRG